ncbi:MULTISPECIES: ABC transporter permease [unclassified Pseudomonas]|uniref:ABC transporter permease n=1 Tax=unclassified Pseudomonas TaxID=196821 RepID=UPI000BC81AE3|nr:MULTISPECIES: ABC transporter permease subunit [unclassified Pseudomonas]PVZ20665.1 octopine/nopaline transport system permease protein [Pseudomonas sp. URIL14HWK12:I12]PVZ27731.1 octopine/nopaline transport system permease protein [Pseudomonas sp. URIL14HWK12:I10]PVZ38620.1 octopine/nopaline transport system permease protein [Pseudomonas sp. URIL14HWK12:I11]SNZ02632.1 octopine/nopaline transport system permease protein [Pseudomonas sp. URIL14HWK12:I9]
MPDLAFLADVMMRLLAALPTTLALFGLSLLFGILLALLVVTLRVSQRPWLSLPARGYIALFRGTPLLVQMFLIYYGLGQLPAVRESFAWPLLRSPFGCAVLSLALCTAAYTAEIIRGGLLAVPRGQVEAALAVGMTRWQVLRSVIAPVTLRQALPAYSTEAILLVKSTALASLVTVWDVTGVAQQIIQRTYRTMEVFACAAAIYLVLNFLLVRAVAWLERKLAPPLRVPPAAQASSTTAQPSADL